MASPVFKEWVVDSMSDGLFAVSAEGLVLFANESFLRQFGHRFEEISGRPCREAIHESICDAGCPFDEVLASGKAVDRFDVDIRGTHGRELSACVNFAPLRDADGKVVGVVETIRDISKLKELRDNLRLTNSMYHREKLKNQTILDNIPSGVYTVDREMRLLSFNRSMERITGYRADEVIGKTCSEVLRSDFCDGGCPLKRSMRTGETLRGVEGNLRSRDGAEVPIASSTAALRDEGERLIGGICSFRDLRECRTVPVASGQIREFQGMISKNHRMHEIFDLIETVAESDANVVVEGESGTGKELIARAIHRLSCRAGKPFVGVNCAALNENLMESELFGHVRGAFTGAVKDRMGRFEMAEGGTLFLDEVSEIGPHLQAKLLRVIQEREYQRVGETAARKADVRMICASNRRLKACIGAGTFRDDLYYRLNVVAIELPPLRDRKEDIPVLVGHFLNRPAGAAPPRTRTISPLAMQALLEYPWPGNVRELENAVERAKICSRKEVIGEDSLPAEIRQRQPAARRGKAAAAMDKGPRGATRLLAVLEECGWNRKDAADRLGVSRVTLWRRMRESGIEGRSAAPSAASEMEEERTADACRSGKGSGRAGHCG